MCARKTKRVKASRGTVRGILGLGEVLSALVRKG